MPLRDRTIGFVCHALLCSAVILVGAACSVSGANESGSGEIATLDDAVTTIDRSGSPSFSSSTTTQAEIVEEMTVEEAQLVFAACMRETYSSWPDPQPDGGFGGRAALTEQCASEQGLEGWPGRSGRGGFLGGRPGGNNG